MKTILLILLSVSGCFAATTITVPPGSIHAGDFTCSTSSTATITTSGSPSSQQRAFVFCNAAGQLSAILPPGVSGSCTGVSPCNVTTSGSIPGGAGTCNSDDGFPQAYGRPSVAMIGCFDIRSDGTLAGAYGADTYYTHSATEGCQCIIGHNGPGPFLFGNNFFEAAGLPLHFDEGGQMAWERGDYTYTRNHFFRNPKTLLNTPTSNGMMYATRTQWIEHKGGSRKNIRGNLFDGSFHETNPTGQVIIFRASGAVTNDANVDYNVFQHVGGIVLPGDNANMNGPNYGPNLSPMPVRFEASNNVLWDDNLYGASYPGQFYNGFYYVPCEGCNGGSSGGFSPSPGWIGQSGANTEGQVFDHNSFPQMTGNVPEIMRTVSLHITGVKWTNNILTIANSNSGYGHQGFGSEDSTTDAPAAVGLPLITARWPGLVFAKNLMLSDINTQSDLNSQGWGTKNYIPANPTSIAAVGFANYAPAAWPASYKAGDYKLTLAGYRAQDALHSSDGKDVGADTTQLAIELGNIQGLRVASISATSAAIVFTAPDSFGCSVDFSSTDATIINSFTRVNDPDTGIMRARSVALTGLTSGTLYNYRVNCASEQPVGTFTTR